MSTLKTTETAESKENLNKWKDIPYSQIERLNIIIPPSNDNSEVENYE